MNSPQRRSHHSTNPHDIIVVNLRPTADFGIRGKLEECSAVGGVPAYDQMGSEDGRLVFDADLLILIASTPTVWLKSESWEISITGFRGQGNQLPKLG